jgi:tRNA threonylcarbamoyladenosine dehydratase
MVKEKLMERYDWQQRTALLLGEEKMERIRNAHVLVVGLGGVGAYAAEMICRAGVGRMTIVDADTVQPTNMNRQLPAMHSTLGMSKAEVLAARYKDNLIKLRNQSDSHRDGERIPFGAFIRSNNHT